ncbi:unnamed protein product [Darwinula stevensoni]|uniref:Uncharacterized protein n=1 Tax=Darwinula stevensoni TaxID=69355 RepID=A0A7R9ADZ1_9CRUS|nr:unnamed protein product [Darwinula stevensoni]CAG0901215.1 unnamed protein product [Darwinula stevensoni]
MKKVKELEERLDSMSKKLAKEEGLKAKNKAKIKVLEKKLEREQSVREEMERMKQKIETELDETKVQVREMKRKLQEQMNQLEECRKKEELVAEMRLTLQDKSKTLAEQEELRARHEARSKELEKDLQREQTVEELQQKLLDALAEERKKAVLFTELKTEHETRFIEVEERLKKEQTVREEMERNQRIIETEFRERKAQEEMQLQLNAKTNFSRGEKKRSTLFRRLTGTVSRIHEENLPPHSPRMPRCLMQLENAKQSDLHALLNKLDKKDLVVIHIYSHKSVKDGGVRTMQRRDVEKRSEKDILLNAELDADWTVHFFGIEKGLYWIMAMPQKCPPLIIAARKGHNIIVRLLFELQHDLEEEATMEIEGKSIEDASALLYATDAGHLDVVKTLVKAGADVNHPTKTNSTPLRVACFNGKLDIVEYLVEQKANVNLPTKFNSTCLMISSFRGHLKIVQYLLEHGADPNFKDNNGRTALHFAARSGHVEIVSELIAHGAKMTHNKHMMTPLLIAAEYSQEAVVRYLIQQLEVDRERRTEALELLSASFTKSKDNYHPSLYNAYHYLRKAKEEPLNDTSNPVERPNIEPHGFHQESRNQEKLEQIQFDADALHMGIMV